MLLRSGGGVLLVVYDELRSVQWQRLAARRGGGGGLGAEDGSQADDRA